jgi:hypothetical protein
MIAAARLEVLDRERKHAVVDQSMIKASDGSNLGERSIGTKFE